MVRTNPDGNAKKSEKNRSEIDKLLFYSDLATYLFFKKSLILTPADGSAGIAQIAIPRQIARRWIAGTAEPDRAFAGSLFGATQ